MPSNIPVCRREQRFYRQLKAAQLQRRETASAPTPLQVRGPFVEVLPKQEGAGLCGDSAPQRGGVNEGLCAASPTVCSRCLRAETRQGSTLVFILTQSLRLFTPAQGPVRVVIQRSVRG